MFGSAAHLGRALSVGGWKSTNFNAKYVGGNAVQSINVEPGGANEDHDNMPAKPRVFRV